ncbi:MAG TPA: beta-ketoacyl synthase chain length factor [Noviherbaspirillum sp.]
MHPSEAKSHTAWQVPIAKWVAWGCDPAQAQTAPDLAYIEPLLRRRLSPLARAALHAAHACSRHCRSVRMVYASRHGELSRTIEALRNLARGEVLSPTTFSLSVLNSAAGIFSIARRDEAPATAISAGLETFGFGLLEALTRARLAPGTPVLYVYADAPAPPPLDRQTNDPIGPIALAMLIDGANGDILETTMQPSDGPASNEPQALACLAALKGTTTRWTSGHRQWQWGMRSL